MPIPVMVEISENLLSLYTAAIESNGETCTIELPKREDLRFREEKVSEQRGVFKLEPVDHGLFNELLRTQN